MQQIFFRGLLLIALITMYSCKKESLVGADVVDGDGIEVLFTDTISINASTIIGQDTTITRIPGLSMTNLFLGTVDDSNFGKRTYFPFIRPTLNTSRPDFYNENTDTYATIDSVVLYMSLDTSKTYGNAFALHDIQAFQLEEELSGEETYYLFDNLATSGTLNEPYRLRADIGPQQLFFQNDTFSLDPSIRIPLDKSFIEPISQDTASFESDTTFSKLIRGIKLESTTENSVLALSASKSFGASSPMNKMAVYYTDSVPKVYFFPLSSVRHEFLEIEKENTIAENALNVVNPNNNLLYTQGFNQYDIQLTLPTSTYANWGDVIVKRAELEFFVATDQETEPINSFLLDTKTDEGERKTISDIIRILAFNLDLFSVFGGQAVKVEDEGRFLTRYSMNVTEYFDDLIKESTTNIDTLIITPRSPLNSPENCVILGPDNPEYPMKLKVLYSLPK